MLKHFSPIFPFSLTHTRSLTITLGVMEAMRAAVDCVWAPAERGDSKRERWMTCGVVFYLPSVKEETKLASVWLVCHTHTFFKKLLCVYQSKPQQHVVSVDKEIHWKASESYNVTMQAHPSLLSNKTGQKWEFTCKLRAIWRMYIMLRSSSIQSFSSMSAYLSFGILCAGGSK